jgi:hypothetical protein
MKRLEDGTCKIPVHIIKSTLPLILKDKSVITPSVFTNTATVHVSSTYRKYCNYIHVRVQQY